MTVNSTQPNLTHQRTLIVDDSVSYAAVLKKILEAGLGIQSVQHCVELSTAEQLIRANPNEFSLLFVDYRFPTGGTGVELLEKLRGVLPPESVQFLITSEPTPENVKRALAAGASGVVSKPFDRKQLALQLARAFQADTADND